MIGRLVFATLRKKTPFYVVSHERSGTHFTINTIFANAYVVPRLRYVGDWLGPYDHPATRHRHLEDFRREWPLWQRGGGLVKTHADAPLFKEWYPAAPVVYVWRDPRDTLVSFFHYLNSDELHRTNPGLESQRCSNFAEFLRRPLTDYLKHGFSHEPDFDNVAARWASHVSGWLSAPGICVVRYEQLKNNFREAVRDICRSVGAVPRWRQKAVGLRDAVSVLPRKGVAGEWRKYFTAEDEKFLEEQAARCRLTKPQWESA
jgi:hypothetical protein